MKLSALSHSDSQIVRQNILNNTYAVEHIREAVGLTGLLFDNEYKFLPQHVAEFFEVDLVSIKKYITEHGEELKHNGYTELKGKRLTQFRELFDPIIGKHPKTRPLGVFNFRSLLNLGMLITESDKAQTLRSLVLDVFMDTIHQRVGGNTKYINQRDEEFLLNSYREQKHRKEFTDALKNCVDMGNAKYAFYTDKIYQSIFKENASEYRQILKLQEGENVRDTMYAEVLRMIASFESGFAYELNMEKKRLERLLSPEEVDALFHRFESHPSLQPMIEDARSKMASRDLTFRDALHHNLENYITSVSPADYERFLGEKSKELADRIKETEDVFKRLKDR